MRLERQCFRWLNRRLPSPDRRRIVVLGGARQTGKTTLARSSYPAIRYVNFDDPDQREFARAIAASSWARDVGPAILDEAQKEPEVFEKVKFAFDSRELSFSVLLGSSRIALLERVRESLAGRAFVFDLWPLMVSEIVTAADEEPSEPLFGRLLADPARFEQLLEAESPVLLASDEEPRRSAVDHLLEWGGMPELLALSEPDRREWLRSYGITYLERDLRDLARLDDLMPFRAFQRLTALRAGRLLSYADLARDAGMSPSTARRYLEYLHLSYQALLLPPFARNLTSRIVKAPKLYGLDVGLVRQLSGHFGPVTGPLFENLVVTEAHKWIETAGSDARLSFYRTRSGLEVDLLVEVGGGVIGIEVKNRAAVSSTDLRPLATLADAFGKDWQGGLIVARGREIRREDGARRIWSVPVHRLF